MTLAKENGTKQCSTCLVKKSIEDFYHNQNRIDSLCKECRKNKRNTKHKNNKTTISKKGQNRLNSFVLDASLIYLNYLKFINKELDNEINKIENKYGP